MLLDNRGNGQVGNELKKRSFKDSKLAVLSSLFTVYGYDVLSKELSGLTGGRLLLTDWPSKSLQSLVGTEAEVRLTNRLNQRHVARECARWISSKVEGIRR